MIEPFDAYYTSVPQRSLRAFSGSREPKLMDLLRALLADPLEAEDLAARKKRRSDYALDRFREQGSKAVDAALQTASLWLLRQKDAVDAIGALARWEPWLSIWCGCGVVRSVESTLPVWIKGSIDLLEDVIRSGGYNDKPSDDPAVSSKLELVRNARNESLSFDPVEFYPSEASLSHGIWSLLVSATQAEMEASACHSDRPSHWMVISMAHVEAALQSNGYSDNPSSANKSIAKIASDRMMTFPMRSTTTG
jgi:hypothetical protein